MSKYRNRPTVCNQMHKHASAKEARRCDELNILEKQGVIKSLQQQPKFLLQEKFKFQGKGIREINYIADFGYYDNEKKKYVIEDTKGFRTKIYLLKIKMLLKIKYFIKFFLNTS